MDYITTNNVQFAQSQPQVIELNLTQDILKVVCSYIHSLKYVHHFMKLNKYWEYFAMKTLNGLMGLITSLFSLTCKQSIKKKVILEKLSHKSTDWMVEKP